ncbi:MAG TPA: 30S ribosomal protein S16 [Spirochaetota bacterium]|nr:30S ribosomal protein S16 [Spirochaetota bacterium]HPC39825.1 30S ribosomal protein S16 [Spirochaetota bacterium]HQF09872.1 30S ribosomal protein S16 [Spirochaetota bacterium]HQH98522.1 30S ribosomal protein S16 [Spirochaetota bacterium]
MAVKIRLQRVGTKKKPFYRIIAVDEREKRDGKFIDQLGRYQPIVDGEQLVVDETKLFHWLGKGAVPTHTIMQLLKKKGLWQKFKTAK